MKFMDCFKKRRNNRFKKEFKLGKKVIFLAIVSAFFIFSGKLIFFNKPRNSPEIISPADFSPSDDFKKKINGLGIELRGLPVEDEENLIATLSSGTTIFFKKNENFEQKLPSLQLILKNIRIEGKWPVKIDLRYFRPVVGY